MLILIVLTAWELVVTLCSSIVVSFKELEIVTGSIYFIKGLGDNLVHYFLWELNFLFDIEALFRFCNNRLASLKLFRVQGLSTHDLILCSLRLLLSKVHKFTFEGSWLIGVIYRSLQALFFFFHNHHLMTVDSLLQLALISRLFLLLLILDVALRCRKRLVFWGLMLPWNQRVSFLLFRGIWSSLLFQALSISRRSLLVLWCLGDTFTSLKTLNTSALLSFAVLFSYRSRVSSLARLGSFFELILGLFLLILWAVYLNILLDLDRLNFLIFLGLDSFTWGRFHFIFAMLLGLKITLQFWGLIFFGLRKDLPFGGRWNFLSLHEIFFIFSLLGISNTLCLWWVLSCVTVSWTFRSRCGLRQCVILTGFLLGTWAIYVHQWRKKL